jgi:aminoglycoside 2'-N-acetyltransferase I
LTARLVHSADLDNETRDDARRMVIDAFDGTELDFTDADWEHALGGMHALAHGDDDVLNGHAAVVQRRLIHDGRALRAGYVEGVAVRASHRRSGVGSVLMGAIEEIIAGAYDLGALGATDMAVPLYLGRGWQRWRGPSWALTPAGVVRTADADGAIYVLAQTAGAELHLDDALMADWRDGDVW